MERKYLDDKGLKKVFEIVNDKDKQLEEDITLVLNGMYQSIGDKADKDDVYDKETVDKKIADAISGGEIDLDGYLTKTEAQETYGTLTEQKQLRSDVEDIMGEVASLEADKQNVLDGSYVTKISGDELYNAINVASRTFDGSPFGGREEIFFKTINGEGIVGEGNIEIEGGSGDANVVPITQNDYDNLQDKDPNTIYVITDAEPLTVEGMSDEDKEELKSLRNDVEQALGEIAELGADKQNKLIGNYLVKFEQNGGMIDFTQRGFDGLSESTKSISFKTINGQNILGQGDLKIEGGGSSDVTSVNGQKGDVVLEGKDIRVTAYSNPNYTVQSFIDANQEGFSDLSEQIRTLQESSLPVMRLNNGAIDLSLPLIFEIGNYIYGENTSKQYYIVPDDEMRGRQEIENGAPFILKINLEGNGTEYKILMNSLLTTNERGFTPWGLRNRVLIGRIITTEFDGYIVFYDDSHGAGYYYYQLVKEKKSSNEVPIKSINIRGSYTIKLYEESPWISVDENWERYDADSADLQLINDNAFIFTDDLFSTYITFEKTPNMSSQQFCFFNIKASANFLGEDYSHTLLAYMVFEDFDAYVYFSGNINAARLHLLRRKQSSSGGSDIDAYSKEEADEKFITKGKTYTISQKFPRSLNNYPNSDSSDFGSLYQLDISKNELDLSIIELGDTIVDNQGWKMVFSTTTYKGSAAALYQLYDANAVVEVTIDTNNNRLNFWTLYETIPSELRTPDLYRSYLLSGYYARKVNDTIKKVSTIDTSSFATNEYVDSKLGDINNILENILG